MQKNLLVKLVEWRDKGDVAYQQLQRDIAISSNACAICIFTGAFCGWEIPSVAL